jgi:hypothetical protein
VWKGRSVDSTQVVSRGGAIFNIVFLAALLVFVVYMLWRIYRRTKQ